MSPATAVLASRASRFLVVVAVLFAARASFACAVCGGAKSDNDWAFGITTLVLSTLPPVLFGIAMFFIVRAIRRRHREDEANISTPAE